MMIHCLCPVSFGYNIKLSVEPLQLLKIFCFKYSQELILNLHNLTFICDLVQVFDINEDIFHQVRLHLGRVLCIHDLPGFGRAGLSVIVPVLSALGAQAVAVPTAVLSTHTGGLGTPAKLANPGYGPAALEHYRRLGLRFDCIYSGYLADASQAKLVEQAMDLWPDALTVVDPVMGDHGRMYRGLAPEMVPAMYTLCSRASLILPNTTEAALLLGDPMPGVTGEAELHTAQTQAQRLTRICPRVLITGVAAGRGIACVGADRATGESLVRTPMVPKSFHGTGDIFGAVLVGRLLQGNVLPAAAQAAAVFVADCLKATPDEADERLGVWLESVLPRLMQNPE